MNRVVSLIVDGEELTIDLDEAMVIADADEDRRKVPADIAWWGELYARAVEAVEVADAEYRHWLGVSMNAAVGADGKAPAEWKVKAIVEGSDEFLVMKKRIAAASGNAARTKAVFEAYCHKAELLRQRTRQESTEAFHANQVGRAGTDEQHDVSVDPRARKMAANNQKRK
jgi:hypothetical protein